MDERRSETSERRQRSEEEHRTRSERPVDASADSSREREHRPEPPRARDGKKSSEEIERDIARTRQEMDETVHEIERRIRPERLRRQAQDAVKETVRTSASQAGNRMLETVKDNPIPSLIAGLSIGWIVSKGRSSGRRPTPSRADHDDYNYETGLGESQYQEYGDGSRHPSAGERMRETSQQAREKAQEYGEQAQQYGQQARHRVQQTAGEVQRSARRKAGQFERMIEENPLGAGLATIALGAFAGLMMPSTRREDELMGKTRDRVVHQAQETARDATERAKHVAEKTAEEAQKTAKEEAQRQKEESKASRNE